MSIDEALLIRMTPQQLAEHLFTVATSNATRPDRIRVIRSRIEIWSDAQRTEAADESRMNAAGHEPETLQGPTVDKSKLVRFTPQQLAQDLCETTALDFDVKTKIRVVRQKIELWFDARMKAVPIPGPETFPGPIGPLQRNVADHEKEIGGLRMETANLDARISDVVRCISGPKPFDEMTDRELTVSIFDRLAEAEKRLDEIDDTCPDCDGDADTLSREPIADKVFPKPDPRLTEISLSYARGDSMPDVDTEPPPRHADPNLLTDAAKFGKLVKIIRDTYAEKRFESEELTITTIEEIARALLNASKDSLLGTVLKLDRLGHELVRQIFPPIPGTTLDIVFDGPPSRRGPRFVEAEVNGVSVKCGDWVEGDDDMWRLKIGVPYVIEPKTGWRDEAEDPPATEGRYLGRWPSNDIQVTRVAFVPEGDGYLRQWSISGIPYEIADAPLHWMEIPDYFQVGNTPIDDREFAVNATPEPAGEADRILAIAERCKGELPGDDCECGEEDPVNTCEICQEAVARIRQACEEAVKDYWSAHQERDRLKADLDAAADSIGKLQKANKGNFDQGIKAIADNAALKVEVERQKKNARYWKDAADASARESATLHNAVNASEQARANDARLRNAQPVGDAMDLVADHFTAIICPEVCVKDEYRPHVRERFVEFAGRIARPQPAVEEEIAFAITNLRAFIHREIELHSDENQPFAVDDALVARGRKALAILYRIFRPKVPSVAAIAAEISAGRTPFNAAKAIRALLAGEKGSDFEVSETPEPEPATDKDDWARAAVRVAFETVPVSQFDVLLVSRDDAIEKTIEIVKAQHIKMRYSWFNTETDPPEKAGNYLVVFIVDGEARYDVLHFARSESLPGWNDGFRTFATPNFWAELPGTPPGDDV